MWFIHVVWWKVVLWAIFVSQQKLNYSRHQKKFPFGVHSKPLVPCYSHAVPILFLFKFHAPFYFRFVARVYNKHTFLKQSNRQLETMCRRRRYSSDLPQGGLEVPCVLEFQCPANPKELSKLKKWRGQLMRLTHINTLCKELQWLCNGVMQHQS